MKKAKRYIFTMAAYLAIRSFADLYHMAFDWASEPAMMVASIALMFALFEALEGVS